MGDKCVNSADLAVIRVGQRDTCLQLVPLLPIPVIGCHLVNKGNITRDGNWICPATMRSADHSVIAKSLDTHHRLTWFDRCCYCHFTKFPLLEMLS